jgi:hypothetical protein
MLYSEIIAVCSEIHARCGPDLESLNVKLLVRKEPQVF